MDSGKILVLRIPGMKDPEEHKLVYDTCPFCDAIFSRPTSFRPGIDDQTLLSHIEAVHKPDAKGSKER